MSAGHITQMQSWGKNSLRPETSIFAQQAHYQREKLGVFKLWIWIPLFLTNWLIFLLVKFSFCLSLEYHCSWISEYFNSGLARMENDRWWIDLFFFSKICETYANFQVIQRNTILKFCVKSFKEYHKTPPWIYED